MGNKELKKGMDRKQKKGVKENKFLIGLSFLIVLSFLVLIFAAGVATVSSPVADGNYSTWIFFNCTSGMENALNASLIYGNSSEVSANTTRFLTTITNTTSNQSSFNATISITSLTDGANYNITCRMENASNTVYASAVANITIDNTAPRVRSFYNTTDYANYTSSTGILNLTVNVSDALLGVETVLFKVTNSTGDQLNWSNGSKSAGGKFYSSTINITSFVDGAYTITVWANDSYVNNTNSSQSITIQVDDDSPASSIERTSYTRTALTLTGSSSDVGTGIANCSIDRTGATIARLTSTTWNISETGLSCSTAYSYIMTCTDELSHSASSNTYSFSTDACGGSSSTSGSSSATTTTSAWANTYVVQTSELEAGYAKQLGSKQRMRISIGAATHYVGVLSLTATSATIEISSDPVTIVLEVGQESKQDLNGDGIYDLLVKLVGITNGKADVSVQKISEPVPSGTTTTSSGDGATATTGENGVPATEESTNLTWLWVVLVIVVIAIVVAIVVKKRK